MKTKYYFLALVSLFLIGCSTASKKMQKTIKPGEGMIVGTICIENRTYDSYTFSYANDITSVNDYSINQESLNYKDERPDFKEKGKSYFLFSISKPSGKYKFFKIRILTNTSDKISTIDIPINMKFQVEEGKTTYFGQMNINTKKKIYTVENNIDRDRTWFAKKAPQIQF